MIRRFKTLHSALFLLFLVSMLGLLLIISGLFIKYSTDQYQSKIGEISRKNMSQTVGLIDSLLGGYDSLSKSIIGNFDLQRLLRESPEDNSAVNVINERSITNILGALYYSRKDIIGLYIIHNNDKIYSYNSAMSTIDVDYKSSSWLQELRTSTGEMIWLGVQPKSLIDLSVNRPVFSYGRPIYDLYKNRQVGVVLVEVSAEPFLSALSNLSYSSKSESYIITETKHLIASSSSLTEFPSELLQYDLNFHGSAPLLAYYGNKLIVSAKPAGAWWSIVSSTPKNSLNVELEKTYRLMIFIMSGLVLLSILLATFVSRTISNPLKRLIRQMRQVETGDFRGIVNINSYGEINSVVASFNRMVGTIDDLIERVKLSSISEKNAQLLALQSQVNPHFLYNTLDMIYWMLDEKQEDQLGEVVLALSRMFRYSSQWEEGSTVTLREEIEQMTHVLTVIRCRLGGRLETDIQIAEEWLNTPMPKMTLQPIIENAVKHGLEQAQHTGKITVQVEKVDQDLHILISDNGVGMDEITLQTLMESLNEPSLVHRSHPEAADGTNGSGIGMQNLQRRLVLMFGVGYGLQIESKPGQGTLVKVIIPCPPV
ncbi:sensor histidine kinase [Gorillibacterium massiliense]|uniref:sensor histidine kinase n=1 Tax=Gorillibacterium massiliense TaxID=1280390 RepID=UPI0004B7EB87|nr:sensor histidine kinase [Gorillibacterium massiliense]